MQKVALTLSIDADRRCVHLMHDLILFSLIPNTWSASRKLRWLTACGIRIEKSETHIRKTS